MCGRGFSLTDLLAALVMLVVAIFFCMAARANLDTRQNRIKCMSNLRQIGQALLLYSNDNRGPYPRTKYDRSTADQPTVYTGVDSTDPFSGSGVQANDVSAAFYLLLRTEDVTSQVFICPATGNRAFDYGGGLNTALNKSNFPSGNVLSYSYADPYPNEAAAGNGFNLVQGMDPGFVVVGDMNPGSPALLQLTAASTAEQMRAGNSPNHSTQGQNLLYGDGHVEFNDNPFCGVNRDNIYTYGASGIDPKTQAALPTGGVGIYGSPVGPGDSVLLPAVILPVAGTAPVTTAGPAGPTAGGPPAGAPPVAAMTPVDEGTDLTVWIGVATVVFLIVLLGAMGVAYARMKRAQRDS
jgi:prepilin-type processing-associated H-X9-DG protein